MHSISSRRWTLCVSHPIVSATMLRLGYKSGHSFSKDLAGSSFNPLKGDIRQMCQREWLLNQIISENCEIGIPMLIKAIDFLFQDSLYFRISTPFPPVINSSFPQDAISRKHLVKLFGPCFFFVHLSQMFCFFVKLFLLGSYI